MNIHKLARTTPASRALIAARRAAGVGESVVAGQLGIDRKTVRKWTCRQRTEGATGLQDRSSRPTRSPFALDAAWKDAVLALRRLKFTQAQIAQVLELSKSRTQRVVAGGGLGKLSALEPPVPDNRYERSRPGELVHVDTKKLGRFYRPGHRVTGDRTVAGIRGNNGWEFLHVAIDDRTRLAYAELLADEKGATSAGFLHRVAAFFSRHGIRRIERVMSDNGSPFVSTDFRDAVAALRAKHLRTRPYTPRTNGKAERLIQTMLRLWAYVRPYSSSDERAVALDPWLAWYNRQRPHGSLQDRSPVETLKALRRDNLLGDHT
ncbi:MAG TPA: IS481 family transposase [Polyangia bacterium]|nr:IS481 family transposase [Polyangia bacterium]